MSISLSDQLKYRGERLTPIRIALLDIFEHHDQPLSVPDLQRELKTRGFAANKTTVYRQIETLLNYQILTEINLNDRTTRYELAENSHHHHLTCLSCGKIQDVEIHDDMAGEDEVMQKKYGFTVERHSIEFFGSCAECTKKRSRTLS